MICEIVRFAVPSGITREQIMEEARGVVDHWRAEDNLVRKYFLFNGDNQALGIYLWQDRESAEAAHGEAWRRRLHQAYGSEPSVQYLDALMTIDNLAGTVTEYE